MRRRTAEGFASTKKHEPRALSVLEWSIDVYQNVKTSKPYNLRSWLFADAALGEERKFNKDGDLADFKSESTIDFFEALLLGNLNDAASLLSSGLSKILSNSSSVNATRSKPN